MKPSQFAFACVLFAACNPSMVAAQAFQNLDFESVVLNSEPVPPFDIYGKVASVPGWTFSEFNPPELGPHLSSQPQLFLITDNFGFEPSYLGPPVQGHYSVGLQEGYYFPDNTQFGPSISQTGMIPAGAKSVRFFGAGGFLGGAESLWIVSINGVPVPTERFSDGTFFGYPAYTGTVSADVSAYAGTIATLQIALDHTNDLPLGPMFAHETRAVLDAVRFSPLEYTVVPEPTSIILALVSLGLVGLKSRRKKSARPRIATD